MLDSKIENPLILINDQHPSFSDRWMKVCQDRNFRFRMFNGYKRDFLHQIDGADILLWHWNDREPPGLMFARSMLKAAEASGITVYPDSPTCWHYDDKVAQWLLLQAHGFPVVDTFFFIDEAEAHEWISSVTWPKVFKLKSGSSSRMVQLVRDAGRARELCTQAFGAGFNPTEALLSDAAVKLKALNSLTKVSEFASKLPRKFRTWRARRKMPRERGYAYFQEFLPGNDCDTRITVIGNRVFGFRRKVRANDFRASGSGMIDHDPSAIDQRCVALAREIARTLELQSVGIDFLVHPDGNPRVVEISYCFQAEAIHTCPGHWDADSNWCEGHVWPQDAILDDVLSRWKSQHGEIG